MNGESSSPVAHGFHRHTAGALPIPLDDSFLGPTESSTITSIDFDSKNSNNNNWRWRFGIVGVVSWGRAAIGSAGLVAGGFVDGRWNDFTERDGETRSRRRQPGRKNNKKMIDL